MKRDTFVCILVGVLKTNLLVKVLACLLLFIAPFSVNAEDYQFSASNVEHTDSDGEYSVTVHWSEVPNISEFIGFYEIKNAGNRKLLTRSSGGAGRIYIRSAQADAVYEYRVKFRTCSSGVEPVCSIRYTSGFKVRVDSPNPVVNITSPSATLNIHTNASVNLTASASVASGSIRSVEFLANGALLALDTTPPYQYRWSPSAGSYQVSAKATDNNYEKTYSATRVVNVTANNAPSISLSNPEDNASDYTNVLVEVQADSSDTDGSIKKVEFRLNNSLAYSDSQAPFQFNWTPTVQGVYTLRAIATDDDGATRSSSINNYTVLNRKPTVSLTAPADGSRIVVDTLLYLTAQAGDEDGTVKHVEFRVNDTVVGIDTSAPYSLPWTARTTGSHTVTAIAHDDHNATQSASVTIDVPMLDQSESTPSELTSTNYDVYYGDLDGSGEADIYFHGKPLAGQNVAASFVVYQTGNGYNEPTALTLQSGDLPSMQFASIGEDYYSGDFNGDNEGDVLLRGATENDPALIIAGGGQGEWPHLLVEFSGERRLSLHNLSDRNLSISVSDINGDGRDDLVLSGGGYPKTNVFSDNSGVPSDQRLVEQFWAMKPDASGVTIEDAAFTAPNAPLHENIGTISGIGDVIGGSASYRIPIKVPPGRNKMQPLISLDYSPQVGNGLLGMGWSMSLNSRISRCGNTLVHDGRSRGVQLDNTDKLCLDGQRLLAVSGSYGKHRAIYRTEKDEFTRITQYRSLDNSSSWFKAELKNGAVRYYGADSDSRFTPSQQSDVLSWALTREEDRSAAKNSIIYDYRSFGNGEYHIEHIFYTGSGLVAGNRRITFGYDSSVRQDVSSSYIAGGLIRQTKRLKTISTYYGGQIVRQYRLDYEYSDATNRSLLASIEECGYLDSQPACMPATRFGWQDDAPRFVVEKLGYRTGGSEENYIENGEVGLVPILQSKKQIAQILPRGDVNGDGSVDWPTRYIDAEGMDRGVNNNTLSSHDVCSKNPISHKSDCIDVDFNLDGRTDGWGIENGRFKIAYTPGSWQSTAVPIGYYDSVSHVGDFNGDSWPDVVIRKSDAVQGNLAPNKYRAYLHLYLHTGNTSTPYTSSRQLIYTYGFSNQILTSVQYLGDMDGNGTQDFVALNDAISDTELTSGKFVPSQQPTPDTLYLTKLNASGGIFIRRVDLKAVLQRHSAYGSYQASRYFFHFFTDVNGDGLVDWISGVARGNELALNMGNGNFGSWAPLGAEASIEYRRFPLYDASVQETRWVNYPKYIASFRQFDYNGDGRQELLVPGRLQVEGCRTLFHDGVYKEFCGNELYGNQIVNPTTPWIVAPIDAGRMDDSIYQFDAIHFVENADGSFTAKRKSTPLVASATQNEGVDGFGNGLSDFLFSYGCQGSLVPAASCLNGSKSGVMASKVTGTYINRNRGSASGSERYAAPDMMTSVTDGLGYHNEWIYRPLSSNDSRFSNASQKYYEPDFGYLNQLDAAAKRSHFHFNSSMYVVAEHSTSNAVGGMNKRQYRYKGALFNKEGRGFQGFRSIINEDITAGVKIRSDFHQVFPLAGKLYKQRSWLIDEPENSASPFKESTHSWQIWPLGGRKTTINSTPGSWSVDSRKPYFVGSSSTSTIHRDLPLQSGFRTELYRNTQSSKFDLWGNLTETDTVYSERNNLHRVRSVTRTNFVAADDSNWWLNKPSGIVTIRTAVESRQGVAIDTGTDLDMSITVTFPSWDNVSRMPKQILTKPSSGKWRLSATEYNSFGMPTIVTESAEGESQSHWRTVKTDYSPDGYFVNRITNAKGHTKTSATFPEHGQLGWEKDANGLTTLFDYDEFGRLIGVLPPDQPATYTGYQRCDASCPENTAYRRVITQEGSPKILTFSDSTGRVIAKHKEGFDGRTIITSLEYNALGHKTFESAPAFDSVSSKGVRYLSYDAFGRLTKKQSDQANNQQLITTYSYSGFMTSITAGELTMSRSYNGLNQLINTIDALGGETQYAYDAAGNPIVIQDAYASRIIAKYDALGQKIRVSDPNMGVTTITYTGFGDVSSESDANNQVTRYSYDQLSRKTDLFVDGIHQAHWDYDNAINGVGLLAYEERKDQNVKRVYEYDGLARVSTKTAIIGNESYIERNYYDSNYGRPKGLRYPSGLTLAYQYNDSGYLTEVTNAVSGYSYQKIEAINERGQWSESLLGGGVIETQRTYSDRNGQFLNVNLSSIGFRRQSLDYTYDLYGNLEAQEVNQRFSDSVTSNIEEYYYDDLHRLTTSSRADGVSTNYLYDAVGNFRKKDDFASTYHYEGAKPYAVSKVDLIAGGSIIYQYDSNGNRTHENAAQTVWYNTNNQPIKVARGGNVLNFFYDANYKRYKQVSVKSGETQTTQYVNKSFERIRTGVGASLMVEDRHYLGDFAIFIEKTVDNNTTNTLSYLHKDRLGSTVAILDDLGKFKEASSYDPFGKPRTGDMEDKSTAVLDSKLSTRGFTDHEHLDDVKLIHMNGRGYDYELGQFLSVDPIIVSPTNSQSMNPYSYILNNPLSGTDPTGYAAATCAEGESGSCATIVTREVSKIVTGSRIPQKFNVITKVSTNVGGSYRIEHSANGKSVQFSDKITSAGQIASQKERKNPSSMAYGNHPDFIKGYNRGEPNADLIVSLIPAVAAIEAAKALIGGVKTAIEDGGSLGNVATNIAAEVSTAVIATKLKGIKAAKSVHGNSKASTNQQHLYMIEDVDGNIKKIGVSGQKLNKNGSSRRANSQLKDGDRATVLESGIPGRAAVLQKEGQLVEGLKKVGHELPDNKRPKI